MGGILLVAGFVGGAAYYLLCLAGYAQNLGGGWLIAAIFIPPLDIAYPFVALWKLHYFPWPLFLLGVGSVVAAMAGAALRGEYE